MRAEFRLDSEVMGLLQDFDAADSKVIFEIKVNLVDVLNRTLVNSQSFGYVQPANGENPEAGIAAANHALERFLVDLRKLLAEFFGGNHLQN